MKWNGCVMPAYLQQIIVKSWRSRRWRDGISLQWGHTVCVGQRASSGKPDLTFPESRCNFSSWLYLFYFIICESWSRLLDEKSLQDHTKSRSCNGTFLLHTDLKILTIKVYSVYQTKKTPHRNNLEVLILWCYVNFPVTKVFVVILPHVPSHSLTFTTEPEVRRFVAYYTH